MPTPLLTVTSPASDLSLLSLAEMRTAAGQSDGSRDADVKRIGSRVADAITAACKIAADGATPPTLRQESLVDTFRLDRWWGRTSHHDDHYEIILSRRPIVSVTSVVEAGVTLDPSSYEIRASKGTLARLVADVPSRWVPSKVVVTYVAGWATVPEGLKRAAEKLMKFYWSEASRDPLLRSVEVPGILNKTYWIGAPGDPSIPQDVMDDLGPYLNLLA